MKTLINEHYYTMTDNPSCIIRWNAARQRGEGINWAGEYSIDIQVLNPENWRESDAAEASKQITAKQLWIKANTKGEARPVRHRGKQPYQDLIKALDEINAPILKMIFDELRNPDDLSGVIIKGMADKPIGFIVSGTDEKGNPIPTGTPVFSSAGGLKMFTGLSLRKRLPFVEFVDDLQEKIAKKYNLPLSELRRPYSDFIDKKLNDQTEAKMSQIYGNLLSGKTFREVFPSEFEYIKSTIAYPAPAFMSSTNDTAPAPKKTSNWDNWQEQISKYFNTVKNRPAMEYNEFKFEKQIKKYIKKQRKLGFEVIVDLTTKY